jgi:hypothetical protein
VQQVSDANHEQAAAIIASAGFGVRKAASGTKAAFAADPHDHHGPPGRHELLVPVPRRHQDG